MLFVCVGEEGRPERAKADGCSCDGHQPLGVEVESRGIEVGLDLSGGEDEILVALLDDQGFLFFGPELPGHDLLLAVWVVKVGVCAEPWH